MGRVFFFITTKVYKYATVGGKAEPDSGCPCSLTWSPCLDSTVPAITWCSVTLPFSSEGSWGRKKELTCTVFLSVHW